MISIPMKDVKFNVDEEKGVIVAYCDVNLRERFEKDRNKLINKLNNEDKFDVSGNIIWDMEYPEHEMLHAVGIARRDPDEEKPFDIELGKQLAMARMMDEIYHEWIVLWVENMRKIEIAYDLLNEYMQDIAEKISHDLDRRGELVAPLFE